MLNLNTQSTTARGKFFGLFRQSNHRKRQWITDVRKFESDAASISDDAIMRLATELRERFADATAKQKPLLRARFGGLVAESVFRSLGFRLFDVQLEGIGAASTGAIIEMQTGEGKTVVTGCIAALKALEAPSVHVSTTNIYLAERDCDELAPIFDRLGFSHGKLPGQSDESASRLAYRQQIVYGPGYQFGFDYLHDQMKLRQQRKSRLGKTIVDRIRGDQRGHRMIQPAEHFIALIDEADSVMIDEALTPLIISLPGQHAQDPVPYHLAKKFAAELVEGEDYTIKLPEKTIDVTDNANQRVHDKIAGQRELVLARPWKTYISNAIRAEKILQRNIDYVVLDDKIQMVDQYTGRIQPDRTWQSGLHQAIEVKECVPMQPARESTTQITRQRYLQMYDSLSGLTGTAQSVADEFSEIYHCPIVVIPTNRPSRRHVEPTRFFVDAEAKYAAIAEDVLRRHRNGQPILIGTRTIRESMQIDEALRVRNIDAVLLNGVQDGDEAEIVAQAGRAGVITIATNMAGRGTDIKPDERALAAGGLHVVAVSPNESPRIDRQLIGRGARQGQLGSAQFFIAADDSLLVDHNSSLPKQIVRHANGDGESADFSRELAGLQKSIEQRKFKQRQQMILRDRWMDSVRESIEKD